MVDFINEELVTGGGGNLGGKMLEKIKEFLKSMFKSKNYKLLDTGEEVKEPVNNTKELKNVDLKKQIVASNEEEKRILKLQKDFQAGIISEEDLSKEDYNLLTNLYNKQIEKTKRSIQKYKERILYIKSKLEQNN